MLTEADRVSSFASPPPDQVRLRLLSSDSLTWWQANFVCCHPGSQLETRPASQVKKRFWGFVFPGVWILELSQSAATADHLIHRRQDQIQVYLKTFSCGNRLHFMLRRGFEYIPIPCLCGFRRYPCGRNLIQSFWICQLVGCEFQTKCGIRKYFSL